MLSFVLILTKCSKYTNENKRMLIIDYDVKTIQLDGQYVLSWAKILTVYFIRNMCCKDILMDYTVAEKNDQMFTIISKGNKL